ncbi:hypothetical protein F511_41343 [Dorcoceras hygrometricum]|uniref:Uncharacterized protein n=1 Tax=Dorcoceras hygrometricum TaxID=472368 RepID=A0A2Z7BWW5_9LAMI|nr:hypothetical protein F511_41343 [Dorcoceras hygrometricum]
MLRRIVYSDLTLVNEICLSGVSRCEFLLEEVNDGQWSRVVQMSTLVNVALRTGFDPMSLWGWYCFLYVFSGYHGFSAGRGVDPAGGAPGDG